MSNGNNVFNDIDEHYEKQQSRMMNPDKQHITAHQISENQGLMFNLIRQINPKLSFSQTIKLVEIIFGVGGKDE